MKNEVTRDQVIFPVHKESVRAVSGMHLPDQNLVVNSETGQPLGVVGRKYEILPNGLLFDRMSEALDDLGIEHEAKFFTTGARSYMEVELPSVEYHRPRKVGDITRARLLLQNSYDGSLKAGIHLGARRLVCSNGMTAGESFASVMRKHTRNISADGLVTAIRKGLKNFTEVLVPFWNALEEYDLRPGEAGRIIDRLVPAAADRRNDDEAKAAAILPGRYHELVHQIYRRPLSAGDRRDGNLTGLYDAFTETATHAIANDVTPDRLRTFQNRIFTTFREMVAN